MPLLLFQLPPRVPPRSCQPRAHSPRLWPEDVELVHNLWLSLSDREGLGAKLHHRDVVGFALRKLKHELDGEEHTKVVEEMKEMLGKR